MKIKPTGKALQAYERGKRDAKQGKRHEDNPNKIFGHANDMQAAWWSTGWREENEKCKDIKT